MANLPSQSEKDSEKDPRPSQTNRQNDRDVVNDAMLVLGDVADTTWRLFVPIIAGLLIGLYVDSKFATKPWWMLAGIVLGTILAVWLVKLQLKKKV